MKARFRRFRSYASKGVELQYDQWPDLRLLDYNKEECVHVLEYREEKCEST